MAELFECWCGESHDLDNPADAWEAMRNLGHMTLAELRIPELTEWLARKLRGGDS